jgi:hypothetical protein
MLTSNGTQGSGRRALRAAPLGLTVLGALIVGLVTIWPAPGTNQIVLVGYGSSGPEPALAKTSAPAALTVKTTGSFRIAGSAGGLFPGHTTPLTLTATNPMAFKIIVTSITTTVNEASATCLAPNLSVSSFSGHLSVPAHGSAKVVVGASLAQGAPDACISATFPLVYSGLGRRP